MDQDPKVFLIPYACPHSPHILALRILGTPERDETVFPLARWEKAQNQKVLFFTDLSLCPGFTTQKLAGGVGEKDAGSLKAGRGWHLVVESQSEVSWVAQTTITEKNSTTCSFLCLSKSYVLWESNVLLRIKKISLLILPSLLKSMSHLRVAMT